MSCRPRDIARLSNTRSASSSGHGSEIPVRIRSGQVSRSHRVLLSAGWNASDLPGVEFCFLKRGPSSPPDA